MKLLLLSGLAFVVFAAFLPFVNGLALYIASLAVGLIASMVI